MKKRTGFVVAIFAALLLSVTGASAQQTEPPPKPPQPGVAPHPPRPLDNVLFPPELVMRHQRELALTDEQKTFMRSEIQRTSARFNELQWQLQDAMEALHETMKANSVNEQLALSQLDKVLADEREVKRAQMELAIRIKNKLTPEQQTKLHGLKHNMMGPRPGGPGHVPGQTPGPHGPGPRPGGPPPGGPPNRPGEAPPPEPLIR